MLPSGDYININHHYRLELLDNNNGRDSNIAIATKPTTAAPAGDRDAYPQICFTFFFLIFNQRLFINRPLSLPFEKGIYFISMTTLPTPLFKFYFNENDAFPPLGREFLFYLTPVTQLPGGYFDDDDDACHSLFCLFTA